MLVPRKCTLEVACSLTLTKRSVQCQYMVKHQPYIISNTLRPKKQVVAHLEILLHARAITCPAVFRTVSRGSWSRICSIASMHSLLLVKRVQIPILSFAASSITINALMAKCAVASKWRYCGCRQDSQLEIMHEKNCASSSKHSSIDLGFTDAAW